MNPKLCYAVHIFMLHDVFCSKLQCLLGASGCSEQTFLNMVKKY